MGLLVDSPSTGRGRPASAAASAQQHQAQQPHHEPGDHARIEVGNPDRSRCLSAGLGNDWDVGGEGHGGIAHESNILCPEAPWGI